MILRFYDFDKQAKLVPDRTGMYDHTLQQCIKMTVSYIIFWLKLMVAAETASQVEAQSRFRDIAEAYDVTSSLDQIERRCRLSKLGSKSKIKDIKGLPAV